MNTNDRASGAQAPRQPYAASGATQAPQQPKPRLVEVDLVRRYAPHWIIDDDGTARSNNGQPVEVLMPEKKVKLHHEDAGHALQNGIAMPTRNTYRDV